MKPLPPSAPSAGLELRPGKSGEGLVVLSGEWVLGAAGTGETALREAAEGLRNRGAGTAWRVDAGGLERWDSALLVFLRGLGNEAARLGATLELSGLPEGVRTLLELASAAPAAPAGKPAPPPGFLARVGLAAYASFEQMGTSLRFFDEFLRSLGRFAAGRAKFRRADFMEALDDCGPGALPILSLLSFLIGVILSFLGSVQLKLFGAELFTANAVAIGMTREMGGLITGILMAGRTAAAFAARLGTMQVNEEIDALQTMGFRPMDFLVLPRTLALLLTLPLLALYAMAMGILGGAAVGISLLGLTPAQYLHQTVASLSLWGIASGLIKVAAFAVVIAVCGCKQGLQCGRSAGAVGTCTTAAVVQSLVGLVVADSLISILYVLAG